MTRRTTRGLEANIVRSEIDQAVVLLKHRGELDPWRHSRCERRTRIGCPSRNSV